MTRPEHQSEIRETALPSDPEVLPVFRPYLGPEVHAAATQALERGWLGMGAATARFEDEIARYLALQDRHVVATSSGTAAMHSAFVLAGIGPGDEVICPSFTYVSGHQAVTATGAEVVFCDIEERTLGVDPESVRSLVGDRTRAILLLHFAGPAAEATDAVYELARERGLRVVEDAAHAFGTLYDGRPIGSFGDLTCFSFGPVKVITSLEGGAVVAPRAADVEPLHQIRLVGVDKDTAARHRDERTWDYDVVRQGFRYHLGSIPAAIGLSQLALIETFVANRQAYCRAYNERFADAPGIAVPHTDFEGVSPFIYTIRVADDATRRELMRHLRDRGVQSGIHFLGAHEFSFYRGCRRGDLSVTERVSSQILTLPLYPFMDEETIDRVADAVLSFFR
jgi:dTDP-4-amino-4,6-dideoxygalactose transaminase